MEDLPKCVDGFRAGLVNWGGWAKLVSHAPEALLEDISKSVQHIGSCQRQRPPKIGRLSAKEWDPIAETLPSFLNAYLQQEIARILDGPGDLITALLLVNDKLVGELLMALIIVAREHRLHVEVGHVTPYGSSGHWDVCRLACENRSATLTIEIGTEHGEEHLPLVLHYHGQDYVWDVDESTPNNPVWVGVPIDRRGAIFTDSLDSGTQTKQQWTRDEFLTNQGFQPIRFSSREVQKDPFACAVKAVELVTGRNLTR